MTRSAYRATLLVVLLALVAPVWLVEIPPLSDFVNHLARAHVLGHLGDSPTYRDAYAAAWGPYPNLAFDLFAVPLGRAVPIALVGKLFLSATVVIWCAGCVALGRAVTGRDSSRALVACFFVTCEPFLLGYANFTLGTGVALFAIAGAIRARDRAGLAGLGLPAALSLVAAVTHAAAIVTLGLAAAGFALASVVARRPLGRAARDLAIVTPGGVYFLLWLATQADHGKDRAWSSVGTSLRALLTSILPSYAPTLDLVILSCLAAAAASALWLARPIRVDRPLLLAAGLCAAAVFAAPADFAGSYEANGRYALGAWTLGLFAVVSGPRVDRRVIAALGLSLATLFARQALVGRAWWTLGAELVRDRELMLLLPERSTLANVSFLDGRAPRSTRLRELALLHAPALAVLDRSATLPTLYAIPGVQPLTHRRALYDVHRFRAGDVEGPDVARLRAEMSAIWLCRAPEGFEARLGPGWSRLGEVGACTLLAKPPPP